MTKKTLEVNEDGSAAATLVTHGLPANGGATPLEDGSKTKAAADGALPGADNAATIKAKGPITDGKPAKNEELAVVFEGSGISEEVVEKTKILFEAAVNSRVEAERAALEEAMTTALNEQIEAHTTELTENVDKYLDYLATEWLEQNQIAVSNSLKLELFAEFQTALKDLFTEHYIEIPDDKLDALAESVATAEALQAKLDEQIEQNIKLKTENSKFSAEKVFKEISEGLVMTDVEKFKTLAGDLLEGTSDEQGLRNKLTVIRESHFKGDGIAPKKVDLNEQVVTITTDKDGSKVISPSPEMAAIIAAVNKTVRTI